MTGVSTVPDLLKDAIKSVAYEHGLSSDSWLEVERVDSQSDVLSSAYTVMVKTRESGVSGHESETGKCLNLFVKCMEDQDGRFVSEGRIFFKNEIMFYGELLEAFKELGGKCPQVLFKSSPSCYTTLLTPSLSFIIMENLLLQNYQPLPPIPLSLLQTFKILDSLAKLHAISFIMKDQRPLRFHNIVDQISEALFREDMRPTFGKMFVHAIHDALKLAKSSLPPGSVYVDKLAEFTLNVFDRMVKMVKEGEEEYKVVTHGDVRSSNVLMKYDEEGNPVEGCLLDYQGCRYSSPAHDLAFFLLVSLSKPLRDAHLPSLLRRYHGTLCACIAQSGSDPLLLFPMSALRSQLTTHARFALAMALAGLPLYMDEGKSGENASGCGEGSSGEGSSGSGDDMEEMDVVEAAKEATGRKSMRCKNKMMEVVIDAVDLGWL